MSDWYDDLGLGVFIHWGHASTQGWELSWQMTGGVEGQAPTLAAVGCEEYFDNASTFAPPSFDPVAWADLAWRAGARYVVFVAKHHDGFAMFDTKVSDYSVVNIWGRDITAEVVAAFRARGMRVGLYFSMVDWHHPDYPRFTDESVTKPYRVGSYPRGSDRQWAAYRRFMMAQLDELLTGYGALDIVWLDGEFEHTADEWRFDEVRALISGRQPDALVNDRCVGHGDFVTLEQQIPYAPPASRWEVCMTMNSTWGYVPSDDTWKTPRSLLQSLVEIVSMGGNLLLNLGPTGTGELPPPAVERLEALARWTVDNGESLHSAQPGLQPWQYAGPSTQRSLPNGLLRTYLFIPSQRQRTVVVHGLPTSQIASVAALADGAPLPWIAQLDPSSRGSDPTFGGLRIELRPDAVDELCTVVAIDVRPHNR
ncbi:alpha-L-fucosidase [Kribbella aluminosa]|uniref:alpha-L-fucosidase n=1 Tax=Kribbella aluminosa TaxID=416017 RepID=A0ABS4UJT4_9ACTN|nr:alpha-L-fucosidase [Kribbella aluminosa]